MLTRFLVDPLCSPELQVLDEPHVWSSINNVLKCSEGWWRFDELGKTSAFLLHLFGGSLGFLPLFPQLFPLVLMRCLWFWSWNHFLVPASCFVTVVILQDFLMPTLKHQLCFFENLPVSLPCTWRSFMLTAGLSAPFHVSGLLISLKNPLYWKLAPEQNFPLIPPC